MEWIIELATIQDVPALLDLKRKAFGPLCETLGWNDAPPMTESLEHAYEDFPKGIGGQLFREIQMLPPHNHAWLCTCQQVRPPYEFYLHEGFMPYKSEEVGPGLTWVYMKKE